MNKLNWDRNQLWEGCILASVAHAIMVAHFPDISHEQSWDGFNYSVQDSSGTCGTISFHPNFLVGAFRNDHSERAFEYKDAIEYFKGAPEKSREVALEEALLYLLDESDGKTVPVITTAFWGNFDEVFSHDTYEALIENGGFLIERQIDKMESSINEWKEDYDMSETQIVLLKSIFKRKIENPTKDIILNEKEIQMIGSDDEEGLSESRVSFEELGITWKF
ncbi:hypothetical protein ABWK22_22045 [Gottfriedia acidiceleris]|uniref:hypothetical protein n=1 Tax=Gottfriedia acidiceleris TaxID=371036 RepID=UPI003391B091